MTHLIVCTHSRHDLAMGAVSSVQKHAADELRITVLDSSATLKPWGGVEVRHVDCPRYHHAGFARRICRDGELTVCIDDDVRLVSPAHLAERYAAGWHKHLNGHMVQVWTGPSVTQPYFRMPQWRASRRCENLPSVLCEYAAAANAEQIDGIWLHIDKGSTPPTPERDALIRYLDYGPGLGDIVASGLSAIGVTKERVSAAIGRPCNCPKRQAALNAAGRRLGIG